MPTYPTFNDGPPAGVLNYTVKSAAYTAAPGDYVLGNASSAAFSVTLPAVGAGGPVTVKKDPTSDATGNSITVVTNDSSKIDGVTGATGVKISAPGDSLTLNSNGTAWFVTYNLA